jgi:hypothetical protein
MWNRSSVRRRIQQWLFLHADFEDYGMAQADSHTISFAADHPSLGNCRFGDGWARPERLGCWAVGARSVLFLPPAGAAGDHRMTLRLRPYIVPGRIERQRLAVSLNGIALGEHDVSLGAGEKLDLHIPAPALRHDGPNVLAFDHPDFGRPSVDFGSRDSRPLSLLFQNMSFHDSMQKPVGFSTRNARTLFIITGTCLSGAIPNIELVKFLYGDDCDILIWIDFQDPMDFAALSNAMRYLFPRVFVQAAPKALWGGGSIVLSMLRALSYADASIQGWTQAIFTSIRDFPLVGRENILARLEQISLYDFCASRWTRQTSDVMAPGQSIIKNTSGGDDYDIYNYRHDVRFRVSKELEETSPKELVSTGRLTRSVRDRYRISVQENFCTSTLTLAPLSPHRAQEREAFFENFELIAGRMWVFTSRYFAKMLISDEINDVFHRGFRDLLIPDECFFQSVAEFYSKNGCISAFWHNLHYKNANPIIVNSMTLPDILGNFGSGEIFARKVHDLKDYKLLLEAFEQQKLQLNGP